MWMWRSSTTPPDLLKEAINDDTELRELCRHPDHDDLGFLYSIMVVDDEARALLRRLSWR